MLARTTDALRPVALACADFEISIDGPEKLFVPTGARLALEDHLRLAFAPSAADEALIQRVCKVPARNISIGAIQRTYERLKAGSSFQDAFAGVDPPKRGKGKLWAPGDLFETVASCAFTRAQHHLEIYHDKERPSRFLTEAQLIDAPAGRAARKPPPVPGLPDPPTTADGTGGGLRSLIKRLMDPNPQ